MAARQRLLTNVGSSGWLTAPSDVSSSKSGTSDRSRSSERKVRCMAAIVESLSLCGTYRISSTVIAIAFLVRGSSRVFGASNALLRVRANGGTLRAMAANGEALRAATARVNGETLRAVAANGEALPAVGLFIIDGTLPFPVAATHVTFS
mmetsp:Transcript_11706/g.27454  ORF Transcript_11706/g.27454 Transcript_11706/m.27454 type:complete len:150 (+) Transcript_11706:162-611(+)